MRVHVLYHAGEGEVYGAEMIEELARHGYALGPGTLYPLLHSMARAGLLSSESRTVGGKVRKYYRCTDEGRSALAEAQTKIRELAGEIFE